MRIIVQLESEINVIVIKFAVHKLRFYFTTKISKACLGQTRVLGKMFANLRCCQSHLSDNPFQILACHWCDIGQISGSSMSWIWDIVLKFGIFPKVSWFCPEIRDIFQIGPLYGEWLSSRFFFPDLFGCVKARTEISTVLESQGLKHYTIILYYTIHYQRPPIICFVCHFGLFSYLLLM